MPHFWNNTTILVVTADEMIPAFYSSLSALTVAISRASKRGYGIRKVQSGGNGRQLLIDYDSLPENIRLQLGDPRKPLHVMEPYYYADSAAVDFYSTYKPSGKYIKPEMQEVLVTNASVLGALGRLKIAREQERLSKGGSLRGLWDSLAQDCTSFNKILQDKYKLEHTLPSNEQRLRDKFNLFCAESYASLVSKNYGNDSAKKVTDDLVELLNNLFCDSKPTYEQVARTYQGFLNGYVTVIRDMKVDRYTGEILKQPRNYDPKEFTKISKSTIYNYLASWENHSATTKKRSGDRQVYMGLNKPYHSLKQPTLSGSIISIDDRQPAFKMPNGKRVWFYNGADLASLAITTWVFGDDKNQGMMLEFFQQMVRNYHEWGLNLPAELEAESNLNTSFTDTFLSEGVMFEKVRIEANNARGKRIENINRQLRYQLERNADGWQARPHARSEAYQSGPKETRELPFSDIVEIGLKAIEDWNNMPHNTHPEMSRWDYFMQNQNPKLKPTNYKAILPHLGFKTETSCNLGTIKLQGREFVLGDNDTIYFGEKLINLMRIVEGRDVDVYWLDANDGSIIKALVYMGGRLVCEALPKPVYNRARIEQTPEDANNRELMSKYVASVEGYINRTAKTIDKVTVIDNTSVRANNNFKISGRKVEPSREIPAFEDSVPLDDPDDIDEFDFIPTPQKGTSLRDRF